MGGAAPSRGRGPGVLLPLLALLYLFGPAGAASAAAPLLTCPSQRLRGSGLDGTGFGTAVAMTDEFLAVGAPGGNVVTNPGQVFVYYWANRQWTLATTLTNSASHITIDFFGTALAMMRDPDTGVTYLAATAPGPPIRGGTGAASAVLFAHPPGRAASEWAVAAWWDDPVGATPHGPSGFGQSAALSGRFLAFGVSWDATRGGNYVLYERARASADGQSDGWARAASSKNYEAGAFAWGSGVSLAASSVSASPAYMLVGSPRDNLEYKHASGGLDPLFPL